MTSSSDDEIASARADAVRVAEDLRRELAAIGESTEAGPDDEHDAEGPTVGYERARVTALLQAVENEIARFDDAIERRREGRYGRCADCDGKIAPERLFALPGVDRCADCARAPTPHPALRRPQKRSFSG